MLYMQATTIIPRAIPGSHNCSDGLTKVLGQKLFHLYRKFFKLNSPAALSAIIRMLRHGRECEHHGYVDMF